jgi:hypothetical protein
MTLSTGLWVIALLLLVTIPVALLLLQRVLRPTLEIQRHAHAILERAVGISGQLNAIPAFVTTSRLVKQVRSGVLRYGAAIDRIL